MPHHRPQSTFYCCSIVHCFNARKTTYKKAQNTTYKNTPKHDARALTIWRKTKNDICIFSAFPNFKAVGKLDAFTERPEVKCFSLQTS